MLKMIRLQQSQCCCEIVAWLRKSAKFLERHLNYSVYVEHLMDTARCAVFVSLEGEGRAYAAGETFQPV